MGEYILFFLKNNFESRLLDIQFFNKFNRQFN